MNKRTAFTLLGMLGAAGVVAYNLCQHLQQQLPKLTPAHNKVYKQSHHVSGVSGTHKKSPCLRGFSFY